MSLLRHAVSLLATIGSVKLLGIVLAVQVALGLTLVALVATDNLPFVDDGEADGRPARTGGRAERSIASTAPRRSACCAARWSSARVRRARPSRAGSRAS